MTLAPLILPANVEVWVVRGRSWWEARQARERLLLMGLAIVLTTALLIVGVWDPVRDARAKAHADIETYDQLAVRLQAAGPILKPPSQVSRAGSIQSVLTVTAGESALAIKQVDPQGESGVVALDNVDFSALVAWLDRLDRQQGIGVTSAQIERQTAPGRVNARLSVVRR